MVMADIRLLDSNVAPDCTMNIFLTNYRLPYKSISVDVDDYSSISSTFRPLIFFSEVGFYGKSISCTIEAMEEACLARASRFSSPFLW